MIGGQFQIFLDTGLLFYSLNNFFKRIVILVLPFLYAHHNIPVHLQKPTVRIPGKPGISALFSHNLDDVVVHPDGSIWFTDPGYGAIILYEGQRSDTGSAQPYQKEAVYRLDAKTGQLSKVAEEPFKPNGLAFSPDYKKIYIADSGITHYPNAKNIVWQYDLKGDKLSNPRALIDMELNGRTGFPDGLRVDTEGNIWVGAGWVGEGYDGVQVFAPDDGQRIGQIRLPECCANLCFGGKKRNRLFMTASQSLYAVYVETQGAHIC